MDERDYKAINKDAQGNDIMDEYENKAKNILEQYEIDKDYPKMKREILNIGIVRQRSFVNLYEDSDGSFIGEGRYESFKVAYENRDDLKTYKDTVKVIWYVA